MSDYQLSHKFTQKLLNLDPILACKTDQIKAQVVSLSILCQKTVPKVPYTNSSRECAVTPFWNQIDPPAIQTITLATKRPCPRTKLFAQSPKMPISPECTFPNFTHGGSLTQINGPTKSHPYPHTHTQQRDRVEARQRKSARKRAIERRARRE